MELKAAIIFRTVRAEDKAGKTWQRSWKERRRGRRRRRWRRGRPAASEMTPCSAAAMGTSSVAVRTCRWLAHCLVGLRRFWPGSDNAQWQRGRAFLRDLNDAIFAIIFLEAGGNVPPRATWFSIVQSYPGSGEAALQRLLASRSVGGYLVFTGDPASGSPTAYQSSRVARPDRAASSPLPVDLVSNSVHGYLDTYQQSMLRPSNEVEELANFGPPRLCVDPVF